MLSMFLIIPVVKEKTKVKLELAIPSGAPTMFVKEIIDTPPLVALNIVKIIKQHTCLISYCMIFFVLLLS